MCLGKAHFQSYKNYPYVWKENIKLVDKGFYNNLTEEFVVDKTSALTTRPEVLIGEVPSVHEVNQNCRVSDWMGDRSMQLSW